MGFEPQTKKILERLKEADSPELHELSPERAREAFMKIFNRQEHAVPVGNIIDRTIEGPGGKFQFVFTIQKQIVSITLLSSTIMEGGWVVGSIKVMMVYADPLLTQQTV
ncbi:hypothetical protein ACE1TI_11155 [Alteribacillus sp. JSM 102045]|uniref:hypothetical protein n=1 Tax=Alteribacillus sp. JSM 102045 TaxID=1562101 RepID=UPI0035BF063E